ncbi:hypothetical protein HNR37_000006 [Desulfurispira natronophila]|uniref:Uncharacterized protein n=1 Tax=Desulfurispira natronophila TaxID=682562 RepID=A0A7W8DG02_9BACT|nr:hypothetical protein [Desulfurispira natronophila]
MNAATVKRADLKRFSWKQSSIATIHSSPDNILLQEHQGFENESG